FLCHSLPRSPTFYVFPYTTLFRSSCSECWHCSQTCCSRWLPALPEREFGQLHRKNSAVIQTAGNCTPEQHKTGPATCSSQRRTRDRKSTRLNSSHQIISYAVFCLK